MDKDSYIKLQNEFDEYKNELNKQDNIFISDFNKKLRSTHHKARLIKELRQNIKNLSDEKSALLKTLKNSTYFFIGYLAFVSIYRWLFKGETHFEINTFFGIGIYLAYYTYITYLKDIVLEQRKDELLIKIKTLQLGDINCINAATKFIELEDEWDLNDKTKYDYLKAEYQMYQTVSSSTYADRVIY